MSLEKGTHVFGDEVLGISVGRCLRTGEGLISPQFGEVLQYTGVYGIPVSTIKHRRPSIFSSLVPSPFTLMSHA